MKINELLLLPTLLPTTVLHLKQSHLITGYFLVITLPAEFARCLDLLRIYFQTFKTRETFAVDGRFIVPSPSPLPSSSLSLSPSRVAFILLNLRLVIVCVIAFRCCKGVRGKIIILRRGNNNN